MGNFYRFPEKSLLDSFYVLAMRRCLSIWKWWNQKTAVLLWRETGQAYKTCTVHYISLFRKYYLSVVTSCHSIRFSVNFKITSNESCEWLHCCTYNNVFLYFKFDFSSTKVLLPQHSWTSRMYYNSGWKQRALWRTPTTLSTTCRPFGIFWSNTILINYQTYWNLQCSRLCFHYT
jgi:hypothetical protein